MGIAAIAALTLKCPQWGERGHCAAALRPTRVRLEWFRFRATRGEIRNVLPICLAESIGTHMPKYFELADRALIDLRDQRDDLSIRLNILKGSRATAPAELFRLKQDLEVLERRIVNHK
jgi:hypothetical protein